MDVSLLYRLIPFGTGWNKGTGHLSVPIRASVLFGTSRVVHIVKEEVLLT